MRVGLLIARVELTGDPDDPLRARLTHLVRLDRPETEGQTWVATRADLHAVVDAWLDAVLRHDDAGR